jgi:hypothetical protein
MWSSGLLHHAVLYLLFYLLVVYLMMLSIQHLYQKGYRKKTALCNLRLLFQYLSDGTEMNHLTQPPVVMVHVHCKSI